MRLFGRRIVDYLRVASLWRRLSRALRRPRQSAERQMGQSQAVVHAIDLLISDQLLLSAIVTDSRDSFSEFVLLYLLLSQFCPLHSCADTDCRSVLTPSDWRCDKCPNSYCKKHTPQEASVPVAPARVDLPSASVVKKPLENTKRSDGVSRLCTFCLASARQSQFKRMRFLRNLQLALESGKDETGREVDIQHLYRCIMARGGITKCIETEHWHYINTILFSHCSNANTPAKAERTKSKT